MNYKPIHKGKVKTDCIIKYEDCSKEIPLEDIVYNNMKCPHCSKKMKFV